MRGLSVGSIAAIAAAVVGSMDLPSADLRRSPTPLDDVFVSTPNSPTMDVVQPRSQIGPRFLVCDVCGHSGGTLLNNGSKKRKIHKRCIGKAKR